MERYYLFLGIAILKSLNTVSAADLQSLEPVHDNLARNGRNITRVKGLVSNETVLCCVGGEVKHDEFVALKFGL